MTVLDNGAFTYTAGEEIYSLMLPERLVIDQEHNAHISFPIESENGVKDTFRVAHVMGGDFEDDPNRIEVRTGTGFSPVILYRAGEQIDNGGSDENVLAYEGFPVDANGNIVSDSSSGSNSGTSTHSADSGSFTKYYCSQDPATISNGSQVLFASLTYSQEDTANPYQLSLGYGDDTNALYSNWYVTFGGFGETQISTQYGGENLTAEMSDTVTLGGSLDCLELTLVSSDGTTTNHFTMYPFEMGN